MGKNVPNVRFVLHCAVQILLEAVDNMKVSANDFHFINHHQLETVTFNRSVTVIYFEEEKY